jgi:hypothetical protein
LNCETLIKKLKKLPPKLEVRLFAQDGSLTSVDQCEGPPTTVCVVVDDNGEYCVKKIRAPGDRL